MCLPFIGLGLSCFKDSRRPISSYEAYVFNSRTTSHKAHQDSLILIHTLKQKRYGPEREVPQETYRERDEIGCHTPYRWCAEEERAGTEVEIRAVRSWNGQVVTTSQASFRARGTINMRNLACCEEDRVLQSCNSDGGRQAVGWMAVTRSAHILLNKGPRRASSCILLWRSPRGAR